MGGAQIPMNICIYCIYKYKYKYIYIYVIHIAHENQWLEDDPSFWGQKAYFQVVLLLVSVRVGHRSFSGLFQLPVGNCCWALNVTIPK